MSIHLITSNKSSLYAKQLAWKINICQQNHETLFTLIRCEILTPPPPTPSLFSDLFSVCFTFVFDSLLVCRAQFEQRLPHATGLLRVTVLPAPLLHEPFLPAGLWRLPRCHAGNQQLSLLPLLLILKKAIQQDSDVTEEHLHQQTLLWTDHTENGAHVEVGIFGRGTTFLLDSTQLKYRTMNHELRRRKKNLCGADLAIKNLLFPEAHQNCIRYILTH